MSDWNRADRVSHGSFGKGTVLDRQRPTHDHRDAVSNGV
jgi:hypothetical protein